MAVIEVPDWYRTVALIGQDEDGNPLVVLLDSTGAIIAVMKGEYAGDLKSIAVDESGRIVAVIRDPTSDNYIAIDADGYIAAVLKATYSGTLKNVACDDQGRIIMIPTDPADVWGNAISMGNAELAACLSPAKRFDRRGNVYYLTSFEEGLGGWQTDSDGTGALVVVSAAEAKSGAYSVKMVGGSSGERFAEIRHTGPLPVSGKIGFECSFRLVSNVDDIDFEISVYDGTNWLKGIIRYDDYYNNLYYWSSTETWGNIALGVDLFHGTSCFHTVKLVVDLPNQKYVRVILNEVEYDLSSVSLYKIASDVTPVMYCYVDILSHVVTNGTAYVDDVILTQNEPANA